MTPAELRKVEAILKRLERAHDGVISSHVRMANTRLSSAYERYMYSAADHHEAFSQAIAALRYILSKQNESK